MRLVWLTDIHFNFVGTQQIENFLNRVAAAKPDAVLITGDVGEAYSLGDYLLRISDHLQCPVYFVLGNHDYYYSSIAPVRRLARRLTERAPHLFWLPAAGAVALTEDTILLGHGSWPDGRYGDFMNSSVMLNDYVLIRELADISPEERLKRLRRLADEAAHYLGSLLPSVLSRGRHVLLATHAPPFQEACWHNGHLPGDDDEYLPHFTCKAVGDVLHRLAPQYPDTQITVLCGHTHGHGEAQLYQNLRVLTGGAEYGSPQIARVFNF